MTDPSTLSAQDLKTFHQQAVSTHIDLILALEKFMLLYGSLEDTPVGQAAWELKDQLSSSLFFHRSKS